MVEQGYFDIEFPIPEVPEKKCKFCNQAHEPLEYDEAVEGWFHPKCLEKRIEMEIKEALLKSKTSFTEAYNKGGKD